MKPPVVTALIIIAALVPRLVNLDHPLIGAHAWRQADTAAIARNFFEHGRNIFMPRIDWGGAGPGFVEMNFPLFPWLVSLIYAVTGVAESAGRALSAVFSSISVGFVFLFARRIMDDRAAVWAAVFAAMLPLSVYYGRAFMPESLMLMCLFGGLYFCIRWRQDGGPWWAVSAVLIGLCVLIKPTMLVVGLPLTFLFFRPDRTFADVFTDIRTWLYLAIVLIPFAAWYWHAHSLYETYGNTFGIWGLGTDKWGNWELVSSIAYWEHVVIDSLFQRHLALFAAPAFLAGLFAERREENELVLDMLMAGLGIFLFVVGTGNSSHEYYQLPATLAGCLYIGKIYGRHVRLVPPFSAATIGLVVMLAFTAVSGTTTLSTYYRRENPDANIHVLLADIVQRSTVPTDLVVTVDGGNPGILYHSHRKGWTVSAEELDTARIADLRALGADYVVGHLQLVQGENVRNRLRAVLGTLTVVYDNGGFFIVRL